MTTIHALTDAERGILQAYATGGTVVEIARDHGLQPSAVRGLLYRTCDFDLRRAQLVLDGTPGDPPPVQAPRPVPPPAPAPKPTPPTVDTPARAKPATQPSRTPRAKPAKQVLDETGLTYRVLDFWTTRGYLHADQNSPGSGRSRRWSPEEQAVARLMSRLVDAGLTPMGAHHAARNDLQLLDPGIRIVLDDEADDKPGRHRA